jgi:hypothetical protein
VHRLQVSVLLLDPLPSESTRAQDVCAAAVIWPTRSAVNTTSLSVPEAPPEPTYAERMKTRAKVFVDAAIVVTSEAVNVHRLQLTAPVDNPVTTARIMAQYSCAVAVIWPTLAAVNTTSLSVPEEAELSMKADRTKASE